MSGRGGIRSPTERSVTGHQYCGNGLGIEFCERPADNLAGFEFVLGRDFGVCQARSYRNRAVKVVGMGRPEAGDWRFRLSPGCGVHRMGVRDTADVGKLSVKLEMGRKIGRG